MAAVTQANHYGLYDMKRLEAQRNGTAIQDVLATLLEAEYKDRTERNGP